MDPIVTKENALEFVLTYDALHIRRIEIKHPVIEPAEIILAAIKHGFNNSVPFLDGLFCAPEIIVKCL